MLFKSNFIEKGFVDFNRVKSSITKKSLRGDKRMLLKEINQNEEAGPLNRQEIYPSSGESDFFSTTISG